jgi:apolipoprotein N-acyltransferase
MAAFRTVENRIPMIRAANTGLSAFIGIHGNIIDQSVPFTTEVLKATLDIPKFPLTFYTRFGDIFAFVAIAISLIGMAPCIFTRRKV